MLQQGGKERPIVTVQTRAPLLEQLEMHGNLHCSICYELYYE